ncbi:MarR family winged helix-turn-helix transcriptional regulator [Streptomyces sp. NPDC002962]|uniref:MarR family winged helix-turn-helix transcriptional regulator n=1 Tax=Streptomyces sp. NPDC002962 TaxID=3364674 RepID=UPI003679A1ED
MVENTVQGGAGDAPSGERLARPDLAEMVAPLLRTLMAAEQPVLDAHGLTMWAYAVLLHLDETPIRTQAALAEAIRADKTRIIAVLDDLEDRGLIRRRPDPGDRRARLLSLTTEGRRLRDTVQSTIQKGEERLLAQLPPADRDGFLRGLQALSALVEPGATGPAQETGRRRSPA